MWMCPGAFSWFYCLVHWCVVLTFLCSFFEVNALPMFLLHKMPFPCAKLISAWHIRYKLFDIISTPWTTFVRIQLNFTISQKWSSNFIAKRLSMRSVPYQLIHILLWPWCHIFIFVLFPNIFNGVVIWVEMANSEVVLEGLVWMKIRLRVIKFTA